MHIIGTAGHVDHGKSSLVMALTGTNPDRWDEEQRRGMTLDLGFAHLRFDDGSEAGIIDVPGHERFLHNMLAGAAGMDVLILVIAANEGVMPQTIEHLNIVRYLNVRRIVVALTKMDLIEPARGGEICQETHRALHGTIAENAPIFAVSTINGANLDALKQGLQFELQSLPPRNAQAPAYLPIDRVFTLAGRGTIVTGTLMQGRIAAGDTLALFPNAKRVRVRSLQVFGEARAEAVAGTRVALNLAGIERSEITRGDAVADPQFEARRTYSVRFEALPEARVLIRRRTPVRAHVGSAEIMGTLVEGALHLREPVLAFPGVRFVLRRPSPKTLLGGGEIIAGTSVEIVERVDELEASLLGILATSDVPLDMPTLAYAANVREVVAQHALEALVARGEALLVERPAAYLDGGRATALRTSIESALEAMHAEECWAMGATSIALARTTGVAEPVLVRILAALVRDGHIAMRSGYYSLTHFQPRLTSEQRAFFDSVMPIDSAAPLLPAEFAVVAAEVKGSAIAGVARAFDTLLVRGTLVKVGESLYRGSQIEEIHDRIERYVGERGRMTMAEFRDLLQTSRKYAVPLLEWFDGHGITVRNGDYRMLRGRRGEHLPAV